MSCGKSMMASGPTFWHGLIAPPLGGDHARLGDFWVGPRGTYEAKLVDGELAWV